MTLILKEYQDPDCPSCGKSFFILYPLTTRSFRFYCCACGEEDRLVFTDDEWVLGDGIVLQRASEPNPDTDKASPGAWWAA